MNPRNFGSNPEVIIGKQMMNKEHISRRDQNIVKLVFGIPLFFLIGFMVYSFLTKDNIAVVIKENNLAEDFAGKVVSLFKDEDNHNIKTAVLSNKYKYLLPAAWEDVIKIGDSLSKKKNTLKLEVYRQGQPKLVLDYSNTYKKK